MTEIKPITAIKKRLLEIDKNPTWLAEQILMDRAQLSRLLSGGVNYTHETILKIYNALGMNEGLPVAKN